MHSRLFTLFLGGVCLLNISALAQEKPKPKSDPKRLDTQKSVDPKTGTNVDPKPERTKKPKEPLSFVPGQVRIKDIADVQGARGNQIFGYGLVVGLEGTGDGQLSLFTVQSAMNMLKRLGVTLNISPQQLQLKNVAAVMITADLPPFAKAGTRIDVTVSSLGDAKSLQGGVLLQTPLIAANGNIYAVAQGALSIGGLNISAGGATFQRNFVNVGRIPRGAIVEAEVPTTLTEEGNVQLTLRDPDFTTANRVAEELRKQEYLAVAIDAATITIAIPPDQSKNLVGFLAKIESFSVTPDAQARIVINERTGTIVVGGNVRLAPGVAAHGSISIRIENTPIVVPPAPFNPNPGQVIPQSSIEVTEPKAKFAPIPATQTIDQLVTTLNKLGLTPRDLIAVMQAMHRAGMINAQIEVQ